MQNRMLIAGAALVALTTVAPAQQTRRTAVPPPETAITVSLSVKGPQAEQFLTITATDADARDVFREIARKSGDAVLLSPSVSGRISPKIESQPIDKALNSVASLAGLSVRKITMPDGAASLTADAAGTLTEALAALPANASITDPVSGKTLMASASAASPVAGAKVIYYVQGKLTPDQERAAREKRAIDKATQATLSSADTDLISKTVQSFQKMPIQERMQAMRDMQRQMFESMTPEERQQMRDAMRQQRGQRGGFGGPTGQRGGN